MRARPNPFAEVGDKHRLGAGDQRRPRFGPLVPGQMDREPFTSAAASRARRAGPRSSPSAPAAALGRDAAQEPARPLCRCDRLEPRARHAAPARRAGGPRRDPRPKRPLRRRRRPSRGAAVPQARRSTRTPASEPAEPARPFREDCPMTRTFPASLVPASARSAPASRRPRSVASARREAAPTAARPVGQPRGRARADARRLCQRGPGLSLFGRGALPALRGARAGQRHRAAAGRGGLGSRPATRRAG